MGFGNLASGRSQCHIETGMTHYPQCNPTHRATRIKLNTTPALVKLGDGHSAKARLQVISTTGGLLQLPAAISEGDFVEVAFKTHSGGVRGMAEMLNPLHSAPGSVFQPFRFIALDDGAHENLLRMVETISDRDFLGLSSSSWAFPQS